FCRHARGRPEELHCACAHAPHQPADCRVSAAVWGVACACADACSMGGCACMLRGGGVAHALHHGLGLGLALAQQFSLSLFFQLDSILSPPPMPFRKSSNPEVSSGPGKSLKFKRQLSEDGRPFRRGSLGGALTGRYLLPNAVTQHSWQTGETSNLVRMRTQALGQSAPSLTASLVSYISKYFFSQKKD
uniref:Microtubule-associated serine/threonine-protein kinase 4 n=1 Tax=Naja naja TaxID=35670 RepID=A0A8C7DSQ7_NAJNA